MSSMDWVYQFGAPSTLYLNPTNRCTLRCDFCVRSFTDSLGDGHLWGGPEPTLEQLLEAVDERWEPGVVDEVVWCGFGEPTFRLDLITGASEPLRRGGALIRLDTNGHGCLIHRRDVMAELGGAVDVVSISLNAPTAARYRELCQPTSEELEVNEPITPERFWEATLEFTRRAADHFAEVRASVVAHALEPGEVAACRRLAAGLGVDELRLR